MKPIKGVKRKMLRWFGIHEYEPTNEHGYFITVTKETFDAEESNFYQDSNGNLITFETIEDATDALFELYGSDLIKTDESDTYFKQEDNILFTYKINYL